MAPLAVVAKIRPPRQRLGRRRKNGLRDTDLAVNLQSFPHVHVLNSTKFHRPADGLPRRRERPDVRHADDSGDAWVVGQLRLSIHIRHWMQCLQHDGAGVAACGIAPIGGGGGGGLERAPFARGRGRGDGAEKRLGRDVNLVVVAAGGTSLE